MLLSSPIGEAPAARSSLEIIRIKAADTNNKDTPPQTPPSNRENEGSHHVQDAGGENRSAEVRLRYMDTVDLKNPLNGKIQRFVFFH